jgi:hypothetical protein
MGYFPYTAGFEEGISMGIVQHYKIKDLLTQLMLDSNRELTRVAKSLATSNGNVMRLLLGQYQHKYIHLLQCRKMIRWQPQYSELVTKLFKLNDGGFKEITPNCLTKEELQWIANL